MAGATPHPSPARLGGDLPDRVELAVVGGGPAGLAAAAAAAARGREVTVLERNAAIGEPVRTSGGSFVAPLRALGLPDDLWHPVRRIRFVTPSRDHVLSYDPATFCVIDVRRTYQWLAMRAVDAGARLRLGVHVTGPIVEGDRVVGVVLRGGEEVRARLVVDASGYSGVVVRPAGLRTTADRSALGVEREVYAPGYDEDEAVLAVGNDVAPGGYGWAFPTGQGRVRLGVGVVRPGSDAEPRDLLERFVDRLPSLAACRELAEPIETHVGVMPALDPSTVELVGAGVLSAGDAGGQGSTLVGEGIRYAIGAGRLAGNVAGEALAASAGPLGAGELAAYPREWQRQAGRQMRIAYAVHLRECEFGDEDWDRAFGVLGGLPPHQVLDALMGELSPRWAVRLLLTRPGVVLGANGRALLRTLLRGR